MVLGLVSRLGKYQKHGVIPIDSEGGRRDLNHVLDKRELGVENLLPYPNSSVDQLLDRNSRL